MSNNNYKHFLQSVDMQRIYKKHHHGFDRNRIMSCRGISSKPSMLGKSGINNGTISCCMSLSQVGQSTCTVVSCIVDNLANLKRKKSNLNIAHNFYKIVQNLACFQNKPCI